MKIPNFTKQELEKGRIFYGLVADGMSFHRATAPFDVDKVYSVEEAEEVLK